MRAADIPFAHTPPGGYGDEMPPPVLAGCTEPLCLNRVLAFGFEPVQLLRRHFEPQPWLRPGKRLAQPLQHGPKRGGADVPPELLRGVLLRSLVGCRSLRGGRRVLGRWRLPGFTRVVRGGGVGQIFRAASGRIPVFSHCF